MNSDLLDSDSDLSDDEEMFPVVTAAASYFQLFILDGRASSEKIYKRVIRINWWEQIDTVEFDNAGEFYRKFRMKRTRFDVFGEIVRSKWKETHGEHSYRCLNLPTIRKNVFFIILEKTRVSEKCPNI